MVSHQLTTNKTFKRGSSFCSSGRPSLYKTKTLLRKLIGAIRHPTSKIRHPTSDIRHPTSDIRHQTCKNQTSDLLKSDIRLVKIRHPTFDLLKSDIQLANIRHPTINLLKSDIRLVKIQQIQFHIIVAQVGGELMKKDGGDSFSREFIPFLLFIRKWGLPLQCFVCVCLS